MSRYIDADKMIADIKAMARVYDGITTEEIIDYLEKYSSADVVEKKHGRWVHWTGGYECSECTYPTDYTTPYCAYCGAKMDGKEDKL